MAEPKMDRSVSNTVMCTPATLVHAIVQKFGTIAWDLAASADNSVASNYFTIEQDSLAQDWTYCDGLKYLNPPFSLISPWAEKIAEWSRRIMATDFEQRGSILLLVPAAVDSRWWERFVHGKCHEYRLRQRVPFYTHKPEWGFPKPITLCEFGPLVVPGVSYWSWKPDERAKR